MSRLELKQKNYHTMILVQNENGLSLPHSKGISTSNSKLLTSHECVENGTNCTFDRNGYSQGARPYDNSTVASGTNEVEESELNCRNISRNKKFVLVFCCALAFFIAGVGYSILAPIFPKEAAKKGMPLILTSCVFSVLELVSFIVSPIIGSHLTNLGPKFVSLSGIFVCGACTILFGFLDKCPPGTTFIVITFLCRIIGAIGYAANLTAAIAMISSEFPKYVASCMALLTSTNGIGMMTGPAIGGFLFELGGFGLPFFVIGGMYLGVGALIYVVMSPPKSVADKNKVHVLLLLQRPIVLIPMMGVATSAMGISFLDPILATHLYPFHLRVAFIGLMFTLPSLAFTLIAPILGILSDKKDIYMSPIVIGHFVLGLGLLMIGPSDLLPFLSFQLWTVIVGLIFIGIAFGCLLVPTLKCVTVGAIELGFEDSIGLYAVLGGVLNSMYSAGAFVGPVTAGVLVQFLGYPMAYTTMGVLSILMGIVTLLFFTIRFFKKRHTENNEMLS